MSKKRVKTFDVDKMIADSKVKTDKKRVITFSDVLKKYSVKELQKEWIEEVFIRGNFEKLNAPIYREGFLWITDEELQKRQQAEDKPVTQCQHEYVDVGFMQPKLVCKYCDKEKIL